MSQILNNVIKLYEKYGDKIKSDAHLVLLYMKDIDGVEVDKDKINTSDFITKATSPMRIIQAKNAYEILKAEELNE